MLDAKFRREKDQIFKILNIQNSSGQNFQVSDNANIKELLYS